MTTTTDRRIPLFEDFWSGVTVSHCFEDATLSSKFQLSIPKVIREEMHLQAGQQFAIITKSDIISLVPIPELEQIRGIAKGADTTNYRDRSDRTDHY